MAGLDAQGTPGAVMTAPAPANESVLATRKPKLLLRFPGVFLLRLAERTFCGLLFQPPPRITRERKARQAQAADRTIRREREYGASARYLHASHAQSSH